MFISARNLNQFHDLKMNDRKKQTIKMFFMNMTLTRVIVFENGIQSWSHNNFTRYRDTISYTFAATHRFTENSVVFKALRRPPIQLLDVEISTHTRIFRTKSYNRYNEYNRWNKPWLMAAYHSAGTNCQFSLPDSGDAPVSYFRPRPRGETAWIDE